MNMNVDRKTIWTFQLLSMIAVVEKLSFLYLSLCSYFRTECFGSEYFLGCVEALKLHEEWEKLDKWREIIGKKKK